MFVNVFYILRNEISPGSDKKKWNFPIDPHCKKLLTLVKVGNFNNGGLWGKYLSLSNPAEISFIKYIKNVDAHHVSFSSKKQVVKKLSPKSLWQTYMKWTLSLITAKRRLSYSSHGVHGEMRVHINYVFILSSGGIFDANKVLICMFLHNFIM